MAESCGALREGARNCADTPQAMRALRCPTQTLEVRYVRECDVAENNLNTANQCFFCISDHCPPRGV